MDSQTAWNYLHETKATPECWRSLRNTAEGLSRRVSLGEELPSSKDGVQISPACVKMVCMLVLIIVPDASEQR